MRALRVRRVGGEHFEIPIDREVTLIGRGAACDVLLPDDAVSSVHARLEQRKGELWLLDQGSTNGTRLGDDRLGAEAVRWPADALVRIGAFELAIVEARAPVEGDQGTRTLTLAMRLLKEAMGEGGLTRLVVESGPDAGKLLPLRDPGDVVVLGRGEDLPHALADADVSRHHAEVRRDWSGALARDLGSKNGTRRNGGPLVEETRLADGDTLELGKTTLRFHDPTRRYLDELATRADRPERPTAAPAAPVRALPILTLALGGVAVVGALALVYALFR
jgi:pSer/pThr/pTyr-binding forkhead associated (FHA) protein